MLQITKGQSNTLITTCYEKQTLTSPYYLWRFISEGLATECVVIMTYTAQSERFEKWTFIEGTTATLPSGVSEYRIYEQASSTNTNYLSATTLLETGLAYVHGTATETYSLPSYTETFATT